MLKGLVFYKGKLFIPKNSPLKHILLEKFHSFVFGGNSGVHRTFGRLQENVILHDMRKDVIEFVGTCTTCQHTKSANHTPYGLLQPLPILDRVWEDISLDFIIGLPFFQSYIVILVVVDWLSKLLTLECLPLILMLLK